MTKKKVITAVIAGAATGAILGYLFATEKGTEARHKIAEQTGNFFDEVVAHFIDIMQLGKEKASDAYAKAGQVVNKVTMSEHV